MKVLLSGGIKTQNILAGLRNLFKSSGEEFIVVENIVDINDIFAQGDYFDKAIITEQSITNDYTIKDEYEIRRRVNNFANESKARPRKFSYVFLAQTEGMANMIHEEILPINTVSTVVVAPPPYTVSFFKMLIVNDVKQLPEDIVYNPKPIGDAVEEYVSEEEIDDEYMGGNEFTAMQAPMDFDSELYSDENGELGIRDTIDGFEIDGGEDFSNGVTDDMMGDLFGGYDDTEEVVEETQGFEDEQGWEEYNQVDNFDSTDYVDDDMPMDNMVPIEQSSELPDYVTKNDEVPDMYFDGIEKSNQNYEVEDTKLEGFDDDDYDEDSYSTPSFFEKDTYQSYNQKAERDSSYEDANGIGQSINFDKPVEFGDEGQMMYDEGFGDEAISFDAEDYGEDASADEQYEEQSSATMYDEENPISNDDYLMEEERRRKAEEEARAAAMTATVNTGKKRGGLFGKLVGKKGQVETSVMQPTATIGGAGVSLKASKTKDLNHVKDVLRPFAARGNSIVVTGCGGCGTSTVAYNLANIISLIGYTVLLVDFDTEGRTQSYISKLNYESMDPDGANLMSAVNSSTGINTHISVVKQGFHLLTMGLGTDTAPVEDIIHKERLARFINLAKSSHNFIVYDVPFKSATGYLSELIYMSDNLVLVSDASNWGITKTMLSVCNIGSDDMQDTVFTRAQLVFNRYRNLSRVLGNKVKTCADITKVMDRKVLELVGDDPGFHFEDLHIAGIINDDPLFEDGWFEEVQYSDTKKGQDIFINLVESIVLKK